MSLIFLRLSLSRALLAVLSLWLFAAVPLRAANSGLVPVPGPKTVSTDPEPRWDNSSALRPDAILGDSTSYNGAADPHDGNTLQFYSLDIENGFLFAATGQGMQIFNLSHPSPPLSYIFGWIGTNSAFPLWLFSDKDWFIKQIDAPENVDKVVALAMEEQGFAIVNTTDKAHPVVAYQRDVLVYRLYAFTAANGIHYAYATSADGNLYLFNLDAAASMNRCTEEPPAAGCTGVYLGQVGAFGSGATSLAGTGTFVATASASRTTGGISLWNAAIPGAPVKLLSIPGATRSVALWKLGSSYYAAQLDVTGQQLSIYNVSCIATGSCGAASPLWSGPVTSTNSMTFVTASVDGAKAYLYLGAEDLGIGPCVKQREFIYDVSQPSAPAELTPHLNNDAAGGYWGWYYGNCPTGFNLVGPRIGKVFGGRLYRAANSVLDAHKISQAGAGFNWSPAAIYPGTPVQLTDASGGQPTAWSWVFDSGANPSTATPPTSAQQNPANVTYSTPGTKTVTLTATNAQGSSLASQPLTVLDPKPAVVSITVSPANPAVCQPVTFTANGVTGKPPLAYAWNISNGATQASGTTNPLSWSTTGSTPTGSYTAQVTVSNGTVPAVKSVPFLLSGLVPLPANGQFTPTNDPFTANTVQFHVNVPGATSWCWDFDDDNNPGTVVRTCSTDPVSGPNPVHTYSVPHAKVTVLVSNCVNTAGVTSAPLDVTIGTPLKALFVINVLCGGGACFADVGVAVPFLDQSKGATSWDYDWDGDGTWDEIGNNAPKTSHTYTVAGQYFPKLRVRRGTGESDVFTSPNKLIVSGGGPPRGIVISGPSSGTAGQALLFSASGTGGCIPSANGWTWQAPGGTVTGNIQAGGVTISWPGAGTRTVQATNNSSTCLGAIGLQTVSITDDRGSQVAVSAQAGVPVSFTATTANAASYSWSFGDGGTATGVRVTHTWTQNGTFVVQLTVSNGSTSASASLTVVVSNAPVAGPKVIVPWIAQDPSQSSDLYLFNPAASAIDVTLTFLPRGNPPETNPPKSSTTIAAGATLYIPNAVGGLFNRPNATGFVTVAVDKGNAVPVVTAFNTTSKSDGSTFGQTISGVAMSAAGGAGVPQVKNLVGLGNNAVLISSFGVSNPSSTAQDYTLRLVDSTGQQIGTPHAFSVLPSGQRQFLPNEIKTLFGVSNLGDYRVEVRNDSGQLFPFSANLLAGSNDPSFTGAVSSAPQKVYLIGALSTPGAAQSTWQTDVVLANLSTGAAGTDVTFTGTGVTAQPTSPLHLTLQPGETRRLPDLIGSQWGLRNTIGVVTLSSTATDGVFPIVQGQSSNSTNPAKRLGQFMPAMDASQAAGVNASQYLVGLRQDAKYSTTVWVFNPGSMPCSADIVYLGLDGHELGRIMAMAINPGAIRQLNPKQHKLPAGGVTDGFTVQAQVKSGQVLAAAQVVNSATNDPAYVQGATR